MGNWTPSIVPDPDQTVYLVLDDLGRHGRAWCETDAEATDFETIITYLLEGQYNNPCGSSASIPPRGGLAMFLRTLPRSCGDVAV
jgi:hypothetical protein